MLPRPGEVFEARYRIVEILGEGGFATVFRAEDSGRNVALKIIKPEKEGYSRDIQSRFTREVQVLASLRDPHTVRLFDHGRSQSGLLFMVFEFIPGRDLSEILAESDRLPAAIAVRVVRQVALSLREAHANGLLHRDLKPANVLVFEYAGDPWRVKLLDFGIARPMFAADANITKTGELIGTPRYMSPEQLMGADLGPPSDIYSLGLVGLELLMGSRALAGNSWGAQLDRLQSGHVFSIPEMERAGIGLVSIIQRMSARQPEDRFRNMDEVLAAFDALDRGEPIPTFQPQRAYAPPGSTASQSVDPSAASQSMELARAQRDTKSLAAIAAGLVLLVGVAVAATMSVVTEEVPVPKPPPQKREVAGILATTPPDEPQPKAVVTPADMGTNIEARPRLEGCVGTELAGSMTTLPDQVPHALYVPSVYDATERLPLVVVFHEDWQTTETFLRQTELLTAAEERGYALLAPQGSPDLPWRAARDVAGIGPLVHAAQERLCIDANRVFLVGHGSGGTAATLLSCETWAKALVTTSYRPGRDEPLCKGPGLRHLQFHAMLSNRMPVNGSDGGTPCTPEPKASVDELQRLWRDRNNCSTREKPHFVDAPRSGKCVRFDCDAELVSCKLDGGHGFPGGKSESPLNQICDQPVADFPARQLIFDFLDAHPKD